MLSCFQIVSISSETSPECANSLYSLLLLTKGGLDNIDDSLAGIDVGNDLASSGRVFGSFLKNHDLGALITIDS